LSGPPFLPFALPDIGPEEHRQVREVLDSGWLTTGPKTKEFERRFAEYVGAPHAVAVNSGTAALHLALEAAGVRAGDEVIVPTYTFAASAEVVRYFDARPVLVDVEPRTLLVDPDRVAEAVTPRTKAILPVHLAGIAADMDALGTIARRHGLVLVEDAAHSLPATSRGRRIGSFGDLTCFSFYATKTLTTGEGGMICTANEEWANRCRQMSLHGISRDAWKRYTSEGSWYYEIEEAGFKDNLTDLAAALGLAQLSRVDAMRESRASIARQFTDAFSGCDALEPPSDAPGGDQHAWHLYMLRLNLDRLAVDRAVFVEDLRALGIGVSVHFIPLHLHPYYRRTYGFEPDDCPVAHREYLREVSLPIYPRMSESDIGRVIAAVLDVAEKRRR
jgi:dTDP-4-amino-4,6-dideoxygalactose transaminase